MPTAGSHLVLNGPEGFPMSRSLVAFAVVAAVLGGSTAVSAQENTVSDRMAIASAVAAFAQPVPAETAQFDRQFFTEPKIGSSKLLSSLYATTALMQALDVHSTFSALSHGAVEANPMMKGVTSNKAAFIATKAAVAAATIMAARHVAKKNKVAAIVTLIGINSAYAMIANHNYKVANSLR